MRRHLNSLCLKSAILLLTIMLICVGNTQISSASNLDMNYIALNARTGVIYGNFPKDPESVSFILSIEEGTAQQSTQLQTFNLRNGRYYGTGFYISNYQEYIDNIIHDNVKITMIVSSDANNSQTVVGHLRWGISPGLPGVPTGGDYITVELE